MKKLFIVLAVASLGFVACNNEADTKAETDTTVVKVDTTTPPPVDTTSTHVDTTKKVDTAAKK
jgi:hypothetical protein